MTVGCLPLLFPLTFLTFVFILSFSFLLFTQQNCIAKQQQRLPVVLFRSAKQGGLYDIDKEGRGVKGKGVQE